MALLSTVEFRWMFSVAALTAASMMACSVSFSSVVDIFGKLKLVVVVVVVVVGLGEGEGDLRAEWARIR